MHPITQYCLRHGIPILEFARRTDLDPSTIYKIVDRSRSAGPSVAQKIREVTGGEVSSDDLLDAYIMAGRQNASKRKDSQGPKSSSAAPEGAEDTECNGSEAA